MFELSGASRHNHSVVPGLGQQFHRGFAVAVDLDVGIAQLSMHSIREMCGASDVAAGVALFSTFFSNFEAIDGSLTGSD